jgi:cytochrome P450
MLSKLEGEMLFATMARRIARFELTDEPEIRLNNTMRGYARIPLRLHPS